MTAYCDMCRRTFEETQLEKVYVLHLKLDQDKVVAQYPDLRSFLNRCSQESFLCESCRADVEIISQSLRHKRWWQFWK
jgi:hypothetical protein